MDDADAFQIASLTTLAACPGLWLFVFRGRMTEAPKPAPAEPGPSRLELAAALRRLPTIAPPPIG